MIFDRFWKGFGSQHGSILDQFWLQNSIENQGRKKIDFWRIGGVGSAAKAALQGRSPTRNRDVFGLVRHICIEIIDYDNVFYTPDSTSGRCCGGLSTLRGTPPQHLFGVDLLWNDRRDSHYCFQHRSILKSCLESLWVALEGSRAPFWELWGSILGALGVHFGSPNR